MDSVVLDNIIRREGGYVFHSEDKGGATNYGITQVTLGKWRKLGREATPQEVKNLTEKEAREIYTQLYIKVPGFDKIKDEKLREHAIDIGVNSGYTRSISWIQEAVGQIPDGILGPKTLAALDECDIDTVRKNVIKARLKFIGKLITNNPSQAVFCHGWLARISEFI